ncbi:Hsp20/alpha crystallin family protein [Aquibacillus salsiterrae]|uniref:Hsp20/alpha crystallin family protein n=1 Tax=Aquibacillus salsiterrae TaxID=2950439 RepID=A0A9X4AF10_9BACI|nr:Hsp20/alpha crystallin family protein [Aquibacillus salsiterrae]MDC3417386.1 Hsp20/alpha crystallin family protein [Aquibacillus salsiterrae]
MQGQQDYNKWNEARKVLGDDFWDVMSDVMPNVGPRMDMVQVNNGLNIILEIPGVIDENDITIRLKGLTLIVEGTISRPYIVSEDSIIQSERFYGPFKRKIRLKRNHLIEEIKAKYSRGLLLIVVPVLSDSDDPSPDDPSVPIQFD